MDYVHSTHKSAATHTKRAVCGDTHHPRLLGFLGITTHRTNNISFYAGGDLLSHTLPSAVPSARAGLASGFGMGPGVSLPLSTTDKHPGRATWCCVHLVGVVSDTA